MRVRVLSVIAIALFAGCGRGVLASDSGPTSGHDATNATLTDWSPRTSVERRAFVGWRSSGNEPFKYIYVAPDGSRFFFVTRVGDVASDSNRFALYVYSSAEVRGALRGSSAAPTPLAVVVRAAPSHSGADPGLGGQFLDAHWSSDGTSIQYRGVDEDGNDQLFQISSANGSITQLTHWPLGVRETKAFGDTAFAIVATRDTSNPIRSTPHRISTVELLGAFGSPWMSTSYVSYRGGPPLRLSSWVGDLNQIFPSTAAGERLMLLSSPWSDPVPDTWVGYDRLRLNGDTGNVATTDFGIRDVRRFTFVDPSQRLERNVFDAPWGLATSVGSRANVQPAALWASDGRNVILVNTALPLAASSPERSRMSYVVAYNSDAGTWSTIEAMEAPIATGTRRISHVAWAEPGVTLLIEHRDDERAGPSLCYRLSNGRWAPAPTDVACAPSRPVNSASPQLPDGLSVAVEEDANTAPSVVASADGRRVRLTSDDPALARVRLARMQPFQWQTPDGRTMHGGLILPTRSAGLPPLVVASYEYNPSRFLPDGISESYAAQTLAERGIAVLITSIPASDRSKLGTLSELTSYVTETESAIATLARAHLIDPQRVGLIGFSRAGFNVRYMATHPASTHLKAIIMEDSFSGVFSYYLVAAAEVPSAANVEHQFPYGGTFWAHQQDWLAQDPSFNMQHIEAPALVTIHNEGELIGGSFTSDVGSFALTRRPAEFMVYSVGSHSLIWPRERLASIELSADWMSFWLLGIENPDPSKALQNLRWRRLRDSWLRQQAWEAAGHTIGSEPSADFTTSTATPEPTSH